MDANTYQAEAARTLIDNSAVPGFSGIDILAMRKLLTIAQELGNVIDHGKKSVFHETHTLSLEDMARHLNTVAAHCEQSAQSLTAATQWAELPTPYQPTEIRHLWNVSGLVGETAEVTETILESVRNGVAPNSDELAKELGDVLWYVAAIASVAGLDLRDIMAANIAKLRLRYPEGWDKVASAARVDLQEAK